MVEDRDADDDMVAIIGCVIVLLAEEFSIRWAYFGANE